MYDLPEHLSSLNALAPSPSSMPVMDTSAEDAVWHYLNTDELFRNFGVQPSEISNKDAITPASQPKETPKPSPPADLKSFIEQFAADHAGPSSSASHYADFALNIPSFASSSAPTPAATGVSTADIMPQLPMTPWENSPEDDRPSGAKKLKQMGAGQAEIEEDKRRRNTEASARFRAKKKEREQNLERRAKELEGQVAQLTAEKASLENENRLLKAIVLGGNGSHPGSSSGDAIAQLMGKRKRD